jgi:TRAP-type mannitol/chloroaromatic compound transport system permease small subunit
MTEFVKIVAKLIQRSTGFLSQVGSFAILVLMVLTVGDVLGRGFLNMPIQGAYELSQLLLAVFVLLGMAYTQQVEGHVRITFLFSRLPLRLQPYLESITTLLTLSLLVVVTWQSWGYIFQSYHSGLVTSVLRIPVWPFTLLLIVGAGTLCLEFIITLVNCVKRIVGGKTGKRESV